MKLTLQFYSSLRNLPAVLYPFLLTVLFLFSISTTFASWPTELYTGKPLVVDTTANEEAVAAAMAPDGTLRLLTRSFYHSPVVYYELTYVLHALDKDGTLLWPSSNEQKFFKEKVLNDTVPYPVIMKVGPGGETWIVWESYLESIPRPGYLEPSNNSIRAVRFDAEGHQSLEDVIAVEQGPANMLLRLRHVEVLDDGGILLLWEVDRDLGDDAIPYEVRAQKFTSSGTEVWTPGGVVLNSTYDYFQRRFTSGPAASDGDGGLLLTLGNELQRLGNDGSLKWPRGTLEIAEIDSNDQTTMMEIEPGRCLVVGGNARPNLENRSSTFMVEYDSSGQLSPYMCEIDDQIWLTYGPVASGDEYLVFMGIKAFVRLDTTLKDTLYDITQGFSEDGATTGRGSLNQDGLRVEYRVYDTNYLYRIAAFDPSFALAWEHQITAEETTFYKKPLPWLAPDGTTFIFWSEPGLKEGKRDIYANVVNLVGDWGVLETTSVPDHTISLLPHSMTLHTWPNPTNAFWVAEVAGMEVGHGPVTLELYDILGREVFSQQVRSTIPGSIRIPFDGRKYATGTYILRAQSHSGITRSTRIVLVK